MSNLGQLIRSYKDIEMGIKSLTKDSLVVFNVGLEALKIMEDTPQAVNDAIAVHFGDKRPTGKIANAVLSDSKNKISLVLDMIHNNENTKDVVSFRGGDGVDFASRENFLYKELADLYISVKDHTEEDDKTILLEVEAILALKPHNKALLNGFIKDIEMLKENKMEKHGS